MVRSVPEWIAKHDDQAMPDPVKQRVFFAQDGKCNHCGRKLGQCGEKPEYDHIDPLKDGGENRERNIQALCKNCHRAKTGQEASQRAIETRKRKKHLGIKPRKQLIPGSKGSGWRKPMNGPAYRVEE